MDNQILEFFKYLHFSHLSWTIIAPIIVMLVDILSGYIKAVITKNIDSTKMRDGILKKCAEILCILLGFVFKFAFNLDSILYGISIYLIVMELVSILENLNDMGINLKIFDFLKDKEE